MTLTTSTIATLLPGEKFDARLIQRLEAERGRRDAGDRLFACAWVRSHSVAPVISWQKDHRCVALLSHDGSVSYWSGEVILCPSADGIQWGGADWESVRDKLEVTIDRWLTVQYWPTIMPLTLLSGYLLLSKPRSQLKQQVPHA